MRVPGNLCQEVDPEASLRWADWVPPSELEGSRGDRGEYPRRPSSLRHAGRALPATEHVASSY